MKRISKKILKQLLSGAMLVMPLFIGSLIFYLIPFCMVVHYSMRSSAGRNGRFVGIENYAEILNNEMFRLAYENTFRFLAIGLPLILLISYLIALVLKSRVERYKLLKSILLFPYIMPIVGTLLIVDVIFANTGFANELLLTMGLPVQDWLESSLAFAVVVILYLWKNTGYSVVLLLSGLMTIPEEQYAAANLDGAGWMPTFRHITMPQMWYSVFFRFCFP